MGLDTEDPSPRRKGRNYEYNHPEEERALGRMRPVDKSIHRIKDKLHDTPRYDTCYSDAIEGVRTNGTQEPFTVRDALRQMVVYRDALKVHAVEANMAYRRVALQVKNAKAAMSTLKVCRACKGNKGDGDSGWHTWEDCQRCGGAGVLPIVY